MASLASETATIRIFGSYGRLFCGHMTYIIDCGASSELLCHYISMYIYTCYISLEAHLIGGLLQVAYVIFVYNAGL